MIFVCTGETGKTQKIRASRCLMIVWKGNLWTLDIVDSKGFSHWRHHVRGWSALSSPSTSGGLHFIFLRAALYCVQLLRKGAYKILLLGLAESRRTWLIVEKRHIKITIHDMPRLLQENNTGIQLYRHIVCRRKEVIRQVSVPLTYKFCLFEKMLPFPPFLAFRSCRLIVLQMMNRLFNNAVADNLEILSMQLNTYHIVISFLPQPLIEIDRFRAFN